eukprot:1148175-Lingulodinium_polyedra.AAC.1
MRGCVVVFAHDDGVTALVSSRVQFLDYVSWERTRVCRATFAVNLFAVVDAADLIIQRLFSPQTP